MNIFKYKNLVCKECGKVETDMFEVGSLIVCLTDFKEIFRDSIDTDTTEILYEAKFWNTFYEYMEKKEI